MILSHCLRGSNTVIAIRITIAFSFDDACSSRALNDHTGELSIVGCIIQAGRNPYVTLNYFEVRSFLTSFRAPMTIWRVQMTESVSAVRA